MEALPARSKLPPTGVIVLALFWAFGLIGTLSASRHAVVFFGPFILEGLPAMFYSLLSAGAICVLIAGVLLRRSWIRLGTAAYYGTTLGLGLLTMASFFAREAYFIDFFRARAPGAAEYVTRGTVLGGLALVNAVTLVIALGILYYMKKTPYFHAGADR